MATPDTLDFDRAAGRIGRVMLILAICGTAVAFAARGWPWGGGFLLGSILSGLNYRWLRGLVESLDGSARRRRGSVFLAFRYLLLGAAAYVILRFTSISLPAVFAGVFVLIAAVMIEAVIEIAYARK